MAASSEAFSPDDFLAGFAAEFDEGIRTIGPQLRDEIRSSMPASIALRVCGNCGLTWSDPMVAGTAGFYELVYAYMRKADPPRWEFDAWRENGPGGGLLIDVGAGDGGFVAWARSLGYDAHGLELNPAQVEKAQKAGRPVICLPVENMSAWLAERGTPSVITLWHVLEHVADPVALLRNLRLSAGPGTQLVVAVPSDRFFLARRGARPITDFPPHHLTRWTPVALQKLAAATGWTQVDHCYEPIVNALPHTRRPGAARRLTRGGAEVLPEVGPQGDETGSRGGPYRRARPAPARRRLQRHVTVVPRETGCGDR